MTNQQNPNNEDEMRDDVEAQTPLTEEEFFETLDKVVGADTKRDQSPDEGKSKTSE